MCAYKTYLCVYIYIYIYTYMHTYIHTHTYICIDREREIDIIEAPVAIGLTNVGARQRWS